MGLKPTKTRNRKPETLAFLRHALLDGLHDLDLPREWRGRPRRQYRTIARALEHHHERLSWCGNDQTASCVAVLRRVAKEIQGAARDAAEPDKAWLEAIREQILDVLTTTPMTWDTDEQRYVVPQSARQLLDRLNREPRLQPFLVTAYSQLKDECEGKPIPGWHPGAPQHRAAQLAKELSEGHAPLHARLRDLVRNARERGDLPPAVRKGAG